VQLPNRNKCAKLIKEFCIYLNYLFAVIGSLKASLNIIEQQFARNLHNLHSFLFFVFVLFYSDRDRRLRVGEGGRVCVSGQARGWFDGLIVFGKTVKSSSINKNAAALPIVPQ
jgi:hypothetical protein